MQPKIKINKQIYRNVPNDTWVVTTAAVVALGYAPTHLSGKNTGKTDSPGYPGNPSWVKRGLS